MLEFKTYIEDEKTKEKFCERDMVQVYFHNGDVITGKIVEADKSYETISLYSSNYEDTIICKCRQIKQIIKI